MNIIINACIYCHKDLTRTFRYFLVSQDFLGAFGHLEVLLSIARYFEVFLGSLVMFGYFAS